MSVEQQDSSCRFARDEECLLPPTALSAPSASFSSACSASFACSVFSPKSPASDHGRGSTGEAARFRDQLDLVGVDERRLFPDLDGVAAEMRRYYS